jgi:hypothetical protein
LGLAYQNLERWKDAAAAHQTAADLNHDDPDIPEALAYAKSKAAE